jgi:hypothetical protein
LVVSALASKLVLIFKKKFKVAAVPTQELEQKVTFQASRPRTHQSGFLHGNKYTYIHIYIHTHIYIFIHLLYTYVKKQYEHTNTVFLVFKMRSPPAMGPSGFP